MINALLFLPEIKPLQTCGSYACWLSLLEWPAWITRELGGAPLARVVVDITIVRLVTHLSEFDLAKRSSLLRYKRSYVSNVELPLYASR